MTVRGKPFQKPVQLAPGSSASEVVEEVDPQLMLEVVLNLVPVILDEEYEG